MTNLAFRRPFGIDRASNAFNHRKLRLCLTICMLLVPACLVAQSDSTDWRDDRYWLTIQANFIRQQQPSFPAKYSGPNSLSAGAEHASSRVETLYSGLRITQNLEFLLDLESAGGDGLSHALGVAGFTNVDV